MVRDSAGNYWFGQYEAVKVFDDAGNFVGEVGRAGEGPMEWSNAIPAHADRDGHVHVFDTDNLRRSEIGRDFTLADEARIPGKGSGRARPGGWRALGGQHVAPR